jgi:hypothetical protein
MKQHNPNSDLVKQIIHTFCVWEYLEDPLISSERKTTMSIRNRKFRTESKFDLRKRLFSLPIFTFIYKIAACFLFSNVRLGNG